MGKKNRRWNKHTRNSEHRSKRKPKQWARSRKFNRHHIINKCMGGRATLENMLVMDTERHNAWHFLFKNMSFEEVIELLRRTLVAKREQNVEAKISNFNYI